MSSNNNTKKITKTIKNQNAINLKLESKQKLSKQDMKQKIEQEAKQKLEQETKQKLEQETKQKLEQETKQKLEQDIKQKLSKQETKQKLEQGTKQKLEQDTKQKLEQDTKQELNTKQNLPKQKKTRVRKISEPKLQDNDKKQKRNRTKKIGQKEAIIGPNNNNENNNENNDNNENNIILSHKYLTRRGYVLDKKILKKEEYEDIKKELTVKPKAHPDFDQGIVSYEIFEEDENYLYVPRYYGIKNFGNPLRTTIMHKNINIDFKGKLTEEQEIIVNTCIGKIKSDGGGVISLPCGDGKTVVALNIICKLGVKALFIVPKSVLLYQMIERIKQFTSARIGIIWQNKIDVENKDIVVSMIHSIALKEYDQSIFNDFGIVIYDECHRSPSKILSRSFKKVNSTFTVGLSATPRRKDGLIRVMFWNLGDIIFRKNKKKDNRVFVHVFNYDSNDKNYCEKKQYIKRQLKPSKVKTMTNLIDIKNRNIFIVDIIKAILLENIEPNVKNNSFRKILVLSERIQHLKDLKSMVDEQVKIMFQNNIIKKKEDMFTTGLYIGELKKYELEISAQADIIFGSYALAKEGLDIPDLNVLVMASPESDIEQSIGRIIRKQITEADLFPLIIDIVDILGIFNRWYPKREKVYLEQDYYIKKYDVEETKLLSMRDKLSNIIDKDKIYTNEQIRELYIKDTYGDYLYESSLEDNFANFPIEITFEKKLETIFNINYEEFFPKTEVNDDDINDEIDENDINDNNDTDDMDITSIIETNDIIEKNDIIETNDIIELSNDDIFIRAMNYKKNKNNQKQNK